MEHLIWIGGSWHHATILKYEMSSISRHLFRVHRGRQWGTRMWLRDLWARRTWWQYQSTLRNYGAKVSFWQVLRILRFSLTGDHHFGQPWLDGLEKMVATQLFTLQESTNGKLHRWSDADWCRMKLKFDFRAYEMKFESYPLSNLISWLLYSRWCTSRQGGALSYLDSYF